MNENGLIRVLDRIDRHLCAIRWLIVGLIVAQVVAPVVVVVLT